MFNLLHNVTHHHILAKIAQFWLFKKYQLSRLEIRLTFEKYFSHRTNDRDLISFFSDRNSHDCKNGYCRAKCNAWEYVDWALTSGCGDYYCCKQRWRKRTWHYLYTNSTEYCLFVLGICFFFVVVVVCSAFASDLRILKYKLIIVNKCLLHWKVCIILFIIINSGKLS